MACSILSTCSILSMLAIWLARQLIANIVDHRLDARARVAHRPLLVDPRRLFLRVCVCGAGAPDEMSVEIGFPLLVIELGVATMGAGLLLGSPITHRGSFI